MILRVNDMGGTEIYINTNQIIQIYKISDDTYNVYLTGDKTVQVNGQTLRKLVREA